MHFLFSILHYNNYDNDGDDNNDNDDYLNNNNDDDLYRTLIASSLSTKIKSFSVIPPK